MTRPGPPPVPFDDWVNRDTGTDCHEWTGYRDDLGYGHFQKLRAHRVSWERRNGRPIPDGLEIDHLCSNPPCVNPDHLEPVTHGENMRRAASRLRAQNPERHAPLEGIEHGTEWGYSKRGCRCEECTRWNRLKARRQKADRNRRLKDDPSVVEHGRASTYGNWGCRCEPCTEAHSKQLYRRRKRLSAERTAA